MTELIMCKSIRYTYYCEELFVVKHKSKHSCVSTTFYDLGPKMVTKNCHFDYYFNKMVPPVILEGNNELLLANVHGPRSLQCNSQNDGLPQPATAEHTYAVVPRDILCDYQLDLEHASVLLQLGSCTHSNKTKHLTMEFVVNMGFYQLLHNKNPNLTEKVKPNLRKHPQTFGECLFKTSARQLNNPIALWQALDRIDQNDKHHIKETWEDWHSPTIVKSCVNNILIIFTSVLVGLHFCSGGFCLNTALSHPSLGLYNHPGFSP